MKTKSFTCSKWLLSLALLLWEGIALAQVPVISWQKSFGGDSVDYANDIQQTSDGGYIVAVRSYSIDGDVTGNHGNGDYWIVKLDSSGTLSWQKCLGGSGDDVPWSIQQTSDGGYIVAGSSRSTDGDVTGNHGTDDFWIVKLAANGNLTWQKSLGGSQQEWAESIQQTTDGGYIVAGWSLSYDGDVTGNHGSLDYWIVKLDSSGNLAWQKCLGGSDDDESISIQQTTEGGYIVAGWSYSNDGDVIGNHGNDDFWIVKLAANGNLSWQKCLGGSDGDGALCIKQTTDGGYIVAGLSYSHDGEVTGNHGLSDYWIVKLAANGNLLWQKSFGGSNWDDALSVEQTTEGGYIVSGRSMSMDGEVTGNHGSWDYWIIKLTANGNLSWQKCFGGSWDDIAFSIKQTTDGGYIVAGRSGSFDGDVTGNHAYGDVWIVKLKNFGVGIEEASRVRGLNVWPNPAQDVLFVESDVAKDVVILNVTGEIVMRTEIVGKEGLEVSGLPTGVYWVRDVDGGEGQVFIKE